MNFMKRIEKRIPSLKEHKELVYGVYEPSVTHHFDPNVEQVIQMVRIPVVKTWVKTWQDM